jgi:hypothetical protein
MRARGCLPGDVYPRHLPPAGGRVGARHLPRGLQIALSRSSTGYHQRVMIT